MNDEAWQNMAMALAIVVVVGQLQLSHGHGHDERQPKVACVSKVLSW